MSLVSISYVVAVSVNQECEFDVVSAQIDAQLSTLTASVAGLASTCNGEPIVYTVSEMKALMGYSLQMIVMSKVSQ